MNFKKHKFGARQAVDFNGDKYDSAMELEFAGLLRVLGVPFKRQCAVVLQEGFTDEYGACRAIEYRADFEVGNYMIDVKGVATPDFRMKAKIFRAMKQVGKTNYTLLVAFKKGRSFVIWEWEEPRKNSKRKPFDIASLRTLPDLSAVV